MYKQIGKPRGTPLEAGEVERRRTYLVFQDSAALATHHQPTDRTTPSPPHHHRPHR